MIMGMPVVVEIPGACVPESVFSGAFDYLEYVDRKFSTYKPESEISLINRGELAIEESSDDMRAIFTLAEQTRMESRGYFNIRHAGSYDPSGIVKGWAIYKAAEIIHQAGYKNYSVYAGGDIQVSGTNGQGQAWRVGIQNPFNQQQIVKVLTLRDCGIATSGTYARGNHIYNPMESERPADDIVSLTVIGPDVYEADRFATAAFAMGSAGIEFIEGLDGLEGYSIDPNGIASSTSGFERYVLHA